MKDAHDIAEEQLLKFDHRPRDFEALRDAIQEAINAARADERAKLAIQIQAIPSHDLGALAHTGERLGQTWAEVVEDHEARTTEAARDFSTFTAFCKGGDRIRDAIVKAVRESAPDDDEIYREDSKRINREHWAQLFNKSLYIDDAEDRTNFLLNTIEQSQEGDAVVKAAMAFSDVAAEGTEVEVQRAMVGLYDATRALARVRAVVVGPNAPLEALAQRLAKAATTYLDSAVAIDYCRQIVASLKDGDCNESDIEESLARRVIDFGIVVYGSPADAAKAIWGAWKAEAK